MKKESCPGQSPAQALTAAAGPPRIQEALQERTQRRPRPHTNERSRLKKLSTRTQKARGQRSEAGATARAGAQVATMSRERQGLGGRDWSARASIVQG